MELNQELNKEQKAISYYNECQGKLKKVSENTNLFNAEVTADLLKPESYFISRKSGKKYLDCHFFYEYGAGCNPQGKINQIIIKGPEEGGVDSVSPASFKQCSLKELVTEKGVKKIKDGCCYNRFGTMEACHLESKPNHEARKYCGAFCRCDYLSSVIMKDIEKIGNYAFKYCYFLEKVSFAPCLKEIGKEAFMHTAIKEISLPESVETIAADAFKDCSKLEKIHIKTERQKKLLEKCYITEPGDLTDKIICS